MIMIERGQDGESYIMTIQLTTNTDIVVKISQKVYDQLKEEMKILDEIEMK